MAHPELTPLETAQKQLADAASDCVARDVEEVAVFTASGRIVAKDIVSECDLPPADVSAVDGFALSSEMLEKDPDFSFKIIGEAKAGHPFTSEVAKDQALRIYTGAVMPAGPDCVVMHEDCEDSTDRVVSQLVLTAGSNIRPRGENLAKSELLIRSAERLTPAAIGQLSAAGVKTVRVCKHLKTAILSMGDEVVSPGSPLGAGQIFDSNRPMLHALLSAAHVEIEDGGIVSDKQAALVEAYRKALKECDVLISSGGASDGVEDHTQAALKALGAEILFWRVAIKPGRPVCAARLGNKFIFCLPGNPVAVYVCFMLLVKPVLDILAGGRVAKTPRFQVAAGFSYRKKKGRTEFLRVTLSTDESGHATAFIHGRKGAGVISSLLGADGLVEIPSDAEQISAGDRLRFIPFEGGA